MITSILRYFQYQQLITKTLRVVVPHCTVPLAMYHRYSIRMYHIPYYHTVVHVGKTIHVGIINPNRKEIFVDAPKRRTWTTQEVRKKKVALIGRPSIPTTPSFLHTMPRRRRESRKAMADMNPDPNDRFDVSSWPPDEAQRTLQLLVQDLCFWEASPTHIKDIGLDSRSKGALCFLQSPDDSSNSLASSSRSSSRQSKQSREQRSSSSTSSSRQATAVEAPRWKTAVDPSSGKTYYYDPLTRATQWEKVGNCCPCVHGYAWHCTVCSGGRLILIPFSHHALSFSPLSINIQPHSHTARRCASLGKATTERTSETGTNFFQRNGNQHAPALGGWSLDGPVHGRRIGRVGGWTT